MVENLICLSFENGMRTAKSIFNETQARGKSVLTLKAVKSAIPVRLIKRDGRRYRETNSKEVGSDAEQ